MGFIKSTFDIVYEFCFVTQDGGQVYGPVGVGYLPEKSKVFFYPVDGELLVKKGVTNFQDFLRDWVVYTKILNKEQIAPNELDACNRANSYYLAYIEKHFGNSQLRNWDKRPPFSKEWNSAAWDMVKTKPEFYNNIKKMLGLGSENVSTL